MSRKRVGKLCQHKATKVWYMNWKGSRIYFTKDKKESKLRYFENLMAIEEEKKLPWGGAPSEEPEQPRRQLMLREGLALAVADREKRTGRKEHALRKANEDLILCAGGDKPISELCPADFRRFAASLRERYAPSTVGARISNTRSLFKWLWADALIEHIPRYGNAFKHPGEEIDLHKHRTIRQYGIRYSRRWR